MSGVKKDILKIYHEQIDEASNSISYWKGFTKNKKRKEENIKYWRWRRNHLFIGMIRLIVLPLERW